MGPRGRSSSGAAVAMHVRQERQRRWRGVFRVPHKRRTHHLLHQYPAALIWASTIHHPITLRIFRKCKLFLCCALTASFVQSL
jgi:hypothetical protein